MMMNMYTYGDPLPAQRARQLVRALHINEQHCLARNVMVRVVAINTASAIAFCTVQQVVHGLFEYTYSRVELIRKAERALAPLLALGLSPFITIIPRSMQDGISSWTFRLQRFTQWAGAQLSLKGFGHDRLKDDPFGWRKAMG